MSAGLLCIFRECFVCPTDPGALCRCESGLHGWSLGCPDPGLGLPCPRVTPLTRMVDWVSWPLGKNVDKWIVALLKGLAAVKKFSILIEVSLAKIEKVGGPWHWGPSQAPCVTGLIHCLSLGLRLQLHHSDHPFQCMCLPSITHLLLHPAPSCSHCQPAVCTFLCMRSPFRVLCGHAWPCSSGLGPLT